MKLNLYAYLREAIETEDEKKVSKAFRKAISELAVAIVQASQSGDITFDDGELCEFYGSFSLILGEEVQDYARQQEEHCDFIAEEIRRQSEKD